MKTLEDFDIELRLGDLKIDALFERGGKIYRVDTIRKSGLYTSRGVNHDGKRFLHENKRFHHFGSDIVRTKKTAHAIAIADAVVARERGDFEGWDNAMARAEQLADELEQ